MGDAGGWVARSWQECRSGAWACQAGMSRRTLPYVELVRVCAMRACMSPTCAGACDKAVPCPALLAAGVREPGRVPQAAGGAAAAVRGGDAGAACRLREGGRGAA